MNNLTSFLALTAAIFGTITALLALLSSLEPTWRTQQARVGPNPQRGTVPTEVNYNPGRNRRLSLQATTVPTDLGRSRRPM